MILSEDAVTYPDASGDRRLEMELHHGPAKLLERGEAELLGAYPKLKAAERGKLSEARRRAT